MTLSSFTPTPRTTPHRHRDRVGYDRRLAHAILDEAIVCHLSFVVDGEPRTIPTVHARVGDTLVLHGSTGSGPVLAGRDEGMPACVTVTIIDGLVLARSQFNHSVNFRSVIAHGVARPITDATAKRAALTAITDKVAAGRSADSRPPTRRELAETGVLALDLTEVSVKTRADGVEDDDEDLALPHWAGVLPLRLVAGRPEPDAGVVGAAPAYLGRSSWVNAPVLHGEHVILEPLTRWHAEGLFAAIADPEVYRHIPTPRPATVEEMGAVIAANLAAPHRMPFAQRSPATGEIMGTTSYYMVDEASRCVEIGGTQLGRRWWRTGVNTESKLLLLTHAFETLGTVRVEWKTDNLNERSQAAIERLGATREGVFRRHRQRADGTWRDSVYYSMLDSEWPAAKARLRQRLVAG